MNTIASGSWDTTIQIWSIRTGVKSMIINVGFQVLSLKIFNNGSYLASGLYNGQINIYNIVNGNVLITILRGHSNWVNDLVLINNGTLLASSSSDNSIRIWNMTTYMQKLILNGHVQPVFGLKLISLNILASGSFDYTIKLWNITNGKLIRTLANHTGPIWWSLDLLSDGQTLVSGSEDLTVKLWNWTTGQCLNTVNTGLNILSLATIKSMSFEI